MLLGTDLIGGMAVLRLNLQAAGAAISVEILPISPCIAMIFVLVAMPSRLAPRPRVPHHRTSSQQAT